MECGSVLQFMSFPEVQVKKRSKKKSVKNPFYVFMMEKKEEWKAEGRFYNMKELAEECRPHWDLLQTNPKMMESYQRKAEELRGREEKLDCLGRPLKALQLEAERKEQQWADLEAEVREAVKDTSRVDLKRKTFFVAHFNYLCEARGGFPPCEVGIVKFSLEEGIVEAWQEFLSPLDSLPVGYKFECMKFARGTHCLTADFPHLKQDMRDVLRQMLAFMKVEKDSELPVLFVGKNNLEPAEFITNFIVEKAGSSANLRVFPINKLVQELIYHQDTALADVLLEKDTYSHYPGLGCGLHEGLDRAHYCSLSISKRMVFTLFEVASKCHNFQLRVGKHFPSRTRPDVKGEEVDIVEMRLAYDDRINRMIPAPSGVVKVSDPQEEEDQRSRVVENLIFSTQDQDTEKEGAFSTSKFLSADVRERFKVIQAKPKLIKSPPK